MLESRFTVMKLKTTAGGQRKWLGRHRDHLFSIQSREARFGPYLNVPAVVTVHAELSNNAGKSKINSMTKNTTAFMGHVPFKLPQCRLEMVDVNHSPLAVEMFTV